MKTKKMSRLPIGMELDPRIASRDDLAALAAHREAQNQKLVQQVIALSAKVSELQNTINNNRSE